jgi:AraC family transcriptional activator of pobA
MAERLNVSPRYRSGLLKQETGKTALDLIHLFLISKGKKIITERAMNISKTSFAPGFENATYFSRLFKKVVGIAFFQGRKLAALFVSFQSIE